MLYISSLAPTSMPCVGSSIIRIFELGSNHFTSTAFCWLPPDIFLICILHLFGRISRQLIILITSSISFFLFKKPPFAKEQWIAGIVMFSSIVRLRTDLVFYGLREHIPREYKNHFKSIFGKQH
jgi:hypothetical protein